MLDSSWALFGVFATGNGGVNQHPTTSVLFDMDGRDQQVCSSSIEAWKMKCI